MNRLFDMDNGFFRFMGKVFDIILLNVITLIMCIPIVTIGPAITALYYVTLKIVRDEEGYVIKGFFKSFKQNFKQGFILELIIVLCAVVAYFDLGVTNNWMAQDGSTLIKLLFYALVGFTLVAVVTAAYVFPVLAKFENTTKRVLLISMAMAVKYLPQSIFMVVVYIAAGVAVYIYPIMIFFVIGIAAFINSVVLRKIFDNYIVVDSQGKIIEADETQMQEELSETGEEEKTMTEQQSDEE